MYKLYILSSTTMQYMSFNRNILKVRQKRGTIISLSLYCCALHRYLLDLQFYMMIGNAMYYTLIFLVKLFINILMCVFFIWEHLRYVLINP
jgi:hypothetical protein